MERIFHYTIQKPLEDLSIRTYLYSLGYSRSLLLHLKRTPRGILCNGEAALLNRRLSDGDSLEIRLKETASSENILPTPMDLHILHEDEDILVLDKPADTPIHPSMGNHTNTLANGVVSYFQEKDESFVYRCINRLDRDTTGALILAKHAYSAALLGDAIQKHQIHRTYLALVQGICPEKGCIDAPIARKNDSVIERTVDEQQGVPALTYYERLACRDGISLVQLRLETGRTHQIRVHMKHLGFPLLGDYLYNPDYRRISRVSLHSFQLDFFHPITGEKLRIFAPVPDDFRKAWENSI